ncbi:hypothetical protein RW1_043_00160 [Rhodococcus wratislaviensis NBRC 100605]|uniref:Uncharacterized protein n=1 Tax=Rhodococcus wratislaviensis NBRC 100605 TaxID=1219028 RepID=X0Q9J9_RHOWR|nr:hypothetical protein RW1_043_00160 [Rhodococcus wratislaviensis NBRC 100605]
MPTDKGANPSRKATFLVAAWLSAQTESTNLYCCGTAPCGATRWVTERTFEWATGIASASAITSSGHTTIKR